jgi:hypothetical protein
MLERMRKKLTHSTWVPLRRETEQWWHKGVTSKRLNIISLLNQKASVNKSTITSNSPIHIIPKIAVPTVVARVGMSRTWQFL